MRKTLEYVGGFAERSAVKLADTQGLSAHHLPGSQFEDNFVVGGGDVHELHNVIGALL